ncbi:hypothetical protein Pmani_030664 [Petrolisthes manimaculis]|uniref:Chitin-binding type-2 domain-containing protein n=1 Tax=Petrolisthes manimaculis TaxID=1843537 RepID=A0AAE1NV56_9EUCA|nr:hypothetical protein Pmani_030664 [Petrolisthes manimaculis]
MGQICAPSCTGLVPGNQIPDPENCRNYYVCMADGTPSDLPFPCDEGLKFDNTTGLCIDETDAALICGVCPPSCRFSCPVNSTELSFIADASSCSIYYLCSDDDILHLSCSSPDLYFDGEDCQDDPSKCCDGCSVYCYEAFIEMADPSNCNNFYFCKDPEYYPESDDLFTCPSGEKFNSTLGHCSSDATCVEPCA